jgi:hypothetical protein
MFPSNEFSFRDFKCALLAAEIIFIAQLSAMIQRTSDLLYYEVAK